MSIWISLNIMPSCFIGSLFHVEKGGSYFVSFVEFNGYVVYDVDKLGGRAVIWPEAMLFWLVDIHGRDF